VLNSTLEVLGMSCSMSVAALAGGYSRLFAGEAVLYMPEIWKKIYFFSLVRFIAPLLSSLQTL
jgi:hypothetical protein